MAVVVRFNALQRRFRADQFAQLLNQLRPRRALHTAADKRFARVHFRTVDQPFARPADIDGDFDVQSGFDQIAFGQIDVDQQFFRNGMSRVKLPDERLQNLARGLSRDLGRKSRVTAPAAPAAIEKDLDARFVVFRIDRQHVAFVNTAQIKALRLNLV